MSLTVFSDAYPNESASTSDNIDVVGYQCCDKNPESRWRYERHPTDPLKMIKYRYDMGVNREWLAWLLDQDFKAKIKYYEYREGGVWPFKRERWRKTKGKLDVDFDRKLFSEDEDECICAETQEAILKASPLDKVAKTHTFKDAMQRGFASSDY